MFLILIVAYLLGSMQFTYIFIKFFYKKNIYSIGYQNSGFSNVYREFGIRPGLLVGIFDLAVKGFIPIYLLDSFNISNLYLYLSSLVIICGHLFSVFNGFKGGRGILTTIGIVLALGFWKEVLVIILIFKILEYFLWKNNGLSTFFGIITFMFVIPFSFEDILFVIFFELIFILLLFKRVITNNISMNLDLSVFINRVLFDSNSYKNK